MNIISRLTYNNNNSNNNVQYNGIEAPHSGDWLHTLPLSACGLHLEDNADRVAVGRRLGYTVCEAHTCPVGVWSILSVNKRFHARKTRAEFSVMLGSTI